MEGNAQQSLISRNASVFFRRSEMFDSTRPWYVDVSDMSFRAGAGRVTASASGLFIVDASSAPVLTALSANTTVNGEAQTTGDVMLGDNSSGRINVFFDQSAGTLSIRKAQTSVLSFGTGSDTQARIDGIINIADSSGLYQGSGTFASPTTGLKMWAVSSAGQIGVYNGGTLTALMRGSDAITIYGGSSFAVTQALNFKDGSDVRLGEIYGYSDGSTFNSVAMRAHANSTSRAASSYVFSGQEASGIARVGIYACRLVAPNTISTPNAYIFMESDQPNNQAYIQLNINSTSAGSSMTYDVTGVTVTNGIKAFKIDHPLQPEDRWLVHAAVESDGNKTCYEGSATMDAQGRATVQLPAWFNALNGSKSIQLTPFGASAPDLHVARDVDATNTFSIAGGAPGQRVDWFIQAVRRDRWAAAHPLIAEQDKQGERGLIAAQREFGVSEAKSLFAARERRRVQERTRDNN